MPQVPTEYALPSMQTQRISTDIPELKCRSSKFHSTFILRDLSHRKCHQSSRASADKSQNEFDMDHSNIDNVDARALQDAHLPVPIDLSDQGHSEDDRGQSYPEPKLVTAED